MSDEASRGKNQKNKEYQYKSFITFTANYLVMKVVVISIGILLSFSTFCKGNTGKFDFYGKDDSTKFNSLMAGFDYSSNSSSYGRFGSVKQPSYSSYVSFFSSRNFNLGVSGMAIDNTDSTATKFTYQYSLTAGYDLELGKLFTLSTLYSHNIYSKNSYSLNSIYNNEIMGGIDFNWKSVYANSSVYFLMGDKNEWMNSFNAGFNVNINNVFFKGHSISIMPDVNAIMSNQQYYNQYAYKTYWYLVLIAKRRPDITIQKLYNNPEQFPSLWSFLNNPKYPRRLKEFSQLDRDLIISDLFNVKSAYNLSSISFTLPIYYNIGNFSMNFVYSATFPMNLPEYLDNSTIHYFSAGLTYSFIL